ncbi:right-handed parallel beta-helix repeat-containing protein [Vibrio parahaemolyticus]|nr:right-handed parallel beta-helix repeat-containing protein [Vibrio parahaemolyticus]EJG1593236.1 right-handed parallel beta-helix repeat-containing protein [Vibrio parahaemolyticus]
MHYLQNGSQVSERPSNKPLSGTPGWFTESGENNVPSYPGQDWFNHSIAEFQNVLSFLNIPFDPDSDDHLKAAFIDLQKFVNDSVINDTLKYNEFRTLGSKLGDQVSVKDFGAKGDGVADDSDAIQAAIDFVHSMGGGIVLLVRGTYRVTKSIFVKEKVGFLGFGGVIKASVTEASVIYMVARQGVDRNEHSFVRRIIIENDGSTPGADRKDSAGISFWGNAINPGTNPDQENHTGEVLGNYIRDNVITGFSIAVYLGLNTFVGRAYLHSGNHIYDCTYGFFIDDYCEYSTVTANVINKCTYGIYDNGASNCSITGNQLTNHSEAGVYLHTAGRNTKKFIVSLNRLNHNKRGVWVGNGIGEQGQPITQVIICDNEILANNTYGVVFSGGSDNIVCSNLMSGNGDADVYISISCYRIAVKNNNFENTVSAPRSIHVIGHAASLGSDKPYHVIEGNIYKGYSTQVTWTYPDDITITPINAANSIVNGLFEYWNSSGKPPSQNADDAKGNVDISFIPDGTVCKNTATPLGEFWMKLSKPGSFDGSQGAVSFISLPAS